MNSSQRNNLQKQLPPLDRQTSSTTDEQRVGPRRDDPTNDDYEDQEEGPKKNYEQLNLDKLKQMQEERLNE